MRKTPIIPNEHYHIFNRGVRKQALFHDRRDYERFLFLILCFQSPITFERVSRMVTEFVGSRASDMVRKVVEERTVELEAFCIMPNHFHLLVKESKEGGIKNYMQRVLSAYSKYYNTKYQKSGHVFQGPYQAVIIDSNEQLLHVSAYIHRNPREIIGWCNRELEYEWSSLQDFVLCSRWGNLLVTDLILGQFSNQHLYRAFVETSLAKANVGSSASDICRGSNLTGV